MELQENKSKLINKIQWFFFAGVIPFIYATTLGIFILISSGFNVLDTAKNIGQHIPGVSKLIKTDESNISMEEGLQIKLDDLEAKTTEQIAVISKMEKEVELKQQEIERLLVQIEKQTQELKAKEEQELNQKHKVAEIAIMYESMSAQTAAAILTELDAKNALEIVKSLSAETIASIFEELSPEDAARFTEQLTNNR